MRFRLRRKERTRNLYLVQKITAQLVALVALGVFAVWVTASDGLDLLSASTLDSEVARPTKTLSSLLQDERRVSQLQLGRSSATRPRTHGPLREVAAQRARTDAFVRQWRSTATTEGNEEIQAHVRQVSSYLNQLAEVRQRIDSGGISRVEALDAYTRIIDECFEVSTAAAVLDDEQTARDARALIEMTRAREMLSREDAYISGILVGGRFEAGDYAHLVQMAGVRQHTADTAARHLPVTDQPRYKSLTAGPAYQRLQNLESTLINRPRTRPSVTPEQWRQATEPTLEALDNLINVGGDDLLQRAKPGAILVIVRLVAVGGLGLLAVITAIIVSITTARALVRQLERLRNAAWELAEQRLPGVVERLGHGEKVDVAVEAPPLEFGSDEIGQVGRAFNAVQETAIRTAVEQAELRRGIRDVLLSLARRTQTLVHRQLTMLDTMERRRDIEVKELEELFRLDHLATRMRRNAENLIVLSGALPARGWRNSVPMVDVVRAAVGEVEDYTRVTVLPFGPVDLAGRAVGDVTHLLAELIENAVTFSPPDTVVQVGGHLVASGFAIDIEDRGLGMEDDRLAELNEMIANPPDFNLHGSVQLGLFVVGKLAERYGVHAMLKRSPYGGTTAVVLIPRELIGEAPNRPDGTDPDRQLLPVGAGPLPSDGSQPAHRIRRLAATSGNPAPLLAVPSPDTSDDQAVPPAADRTDSALPPVPEIDSTPSGLPVRVPQANLAKPLKDAPSAPEAPAREDETDAHVRPPEETRRIIGSYQEGTRRARAAAEQARADERADENEGKDLKETPGDGDDGR